MLKGNKVHRLTCDLEFVCSLRLILWLPSHSFEDMTYLQNLDSIQPFTCSFDAIKSVLSK